MSRVDQKTVGKLGLLFTCRNHDLKVNDPLWILVGLAGFEPTTFAQEQRDADPYGFL